MSKHDGFLERGAVRGAASTPRSTLAWHRLQRQVWPAEVGAARGEDRGLGAGQRRPPEFKEAICG